jgi:hypothetical protein
VRGLTVYDKLDDQHGNSVRVQQASPGAVPGDCAWIFCEDGNGQGCSPLLTVAQAARVRDALAAFVAEHEEPS